MAWRVCVVLSVVEEQDTTRDSISQFSTCIRFTIGSEEGFAEASSVRVSMARRGDCRGGPVTWPEVASDDSELTETVLAGDPVKIGESESK